MNELLRGIRTHFHHFIQGLDAADLHQATLGLSHSFSRSKVKFNVHRVDNMIIQAIAILDQLDKDLNTFSMRVREWYSQHFPELIRIVPDNLMFINCCRFIKDKSTLTEEKLDDLTEIVGDPETAKQIIEASRMSMGTDISPIDLINIERFASRVADLHDYRKGLREYLVSKMNACAPNLTALIGERVGARLISHAGSLTNLAKHAASTVQVLGAEKALFRALKTKGNTPKYGLIYHSPFIGQAATKNKGRISRYLANKCSLASRIDCFSDQATPEYGLMLRKQVEERLEFYKTGATPQKNLDVMEAVAKKLRTTQENGVTAEEESSDDDEMDVDEEEGLEKEKKKKKKKSSKKSSKKDKKKSSKKKSKSKKRKRDEDAADEETEEPEDGGKKKSKKSKKRKVEDAAATEEGESKKKSKKKKSKKKKSKKE